MNPLILLTAQKTRAAEEMAIEAGVVSAQLMERAGQALGVLIEQVFQQQIAATRDKSSLVHDQQGETHQGNGNHNKSENEDTVTKPLVVVLCGPGKNGGDGFVAARRLHDLGWPVRVATLIPRENFSGDARLMADLYEGEPVPLTPSALEGAGLIVDAILGTGLSRDISDELSVMVNAVNGSGFPVVAIDIPTGVHADTGMIMGAAIKAGRTLTFITRKPGHVLYPGRAFCGITEIAPVGVPDEIIAKTGPQMMVNDLAIWGRVWPRPGPLTHKYQRGASVIVSGGVSSTGAARLAARGALRAGAGIVTVLCPASALLVNATHLTAIMVSAGDTPEQISDHLSDPRISSVVIGPGLGLDLANREKILACLKGSHSTVLDADAFTLFSDQPEDLLSALQSRHVLTPHDGEFARLFPGLDLQKLGRVEAARQGAALSGAVVVLKGADSIIAHPDGRIAINANATPDLATAGSGDVLAGFIAALAGARLPNHELMPTFEAACGGVWLHGACGQVAGPGLIAEDLPEAIPTVLRKLAGG